jgi:hypothetical protein
VVDYSGRTYDSYEVEVVVEHIEHVVAAAVVGAAGMEYGDLSSYVAGVGLVIEDVVAAVGVVVVEDEESESEVVVQPVVQPSTVQGRVVGVVVDVVVDAE